MVHPSHLTSLLTGLLVPPLCVCVQCRLTFRPGKAPGDHARSTQSQPTGPGVGWARQLQQSWNRGLISLPGGAVHSHELTREAFPSSERVEVRKGVPATGNRLGRGRGLESV